MFATNILLLVLSFCFFPFINFWLDGGFGGTVSLGVVILSFMIMALSVYTDFFWLMWLPLFCPGWIILWNWLFCWSIGISILVGLVMLLCIIVHAACSCMKEDFPGFCYGNVGGSFWEPISFVLLTIVGVGITIWLVGWTPRMSFAGGRLTTTINQFYWLCHWAYNFFTFFYYSVRFCYLVLFS